MSCPYKDHYSIAVIAGNNCTRDLVGQVMAHQTIVRVQATAHARLASPIVNDNATSAWATIIVNKTC